MCILKARFNMNTYELAGSLMTKAAPGRRVGSKGSKGGLVGEVGPGGIRPGVRPLSCAHARLSLSATGAARPGHRVALSPAHH